jgi:hypothetical protein
VNLSRVTWLVLGTTLVLVSAVLLAAVFFINGTSEHFPSGTGPGGSGVVRVKPVHGGPGRRHRTAAAHNRAGGRLTLATTTARRVAAHPAAVHPAAVGVTAPLGPVVPPLPNGRKPGGPPGQQYGDTLQQLNAKLGLP